MKIRTADNVLIQYPQLSCLNEPHPLWSHPNVRLVPVIDMRCMAGTGMLKVLASALLSRGVVGCNALSYIEKISESAPGVVGLLPALCRVRELCKLSLRKPGADPGSK